MPRKKEPSRNEWAPQTYDPDGKPADPTPRREIKLSTLRDVRIELAHLYREISAGSIESSDGSRRAYVLKTIGDLIALSDLEKRIEELEERRGFQPPALPSRTVN